MISRLIFAICIVIPVTGFSTSLLIDVDKPYSTGVRTIVSTNPFKFNYDTIKFSNGASLSFFSDLINVTEWLEGIIGLCIDSSKYILSAGFRYSPAAAWQVDTNIRKVTTPVPYYKTSDTLAYISKRFPDSLVHPDSVNDIFNINPLKRKLGKQLFAYHSGCVPSSYLCGSERTMRVTGFNNILYLKTTKNKQKFQVSNIFQSSHPDSLHPNYPPKILVDSIRILWAVDSLGNGIFKDETSIRNLQNLSGNSAQKSGSRTINQRTMCDLMQSKAPVDLCNLTGQKIGFLSDHQMHLVSGGKSAAGILFYKINFPDKSMEWGKVMVQ